MPREQEHGFITITFSTFRNYTAMTAADKYFLKAKENYPDNLDDALEALEYGLSCDDVHPGLLTLQGDIYFEGLGQFDAARECFELALISDPGYIETYYSFIGFCMSMHEYGRVEKLADTVLKLKGADRPRVYYYKARMFEGLGEYRLAMDCIQQAKECCVSKQHYTFLEAEASRIELKERTIREYKAPINIVVTS